MSRWGLNQVVRAAFSVLVASVLVGCGAGQVEHEALPDEPYEAVDYRLYPAPEGGYVGDTMPFVTEAGELELYYLFETDHNGQGYHPIHKFVTADLCSYEDEGKVLDYGLMSDPDPAIGTGSVLEDKQGLYHLFYTGHNDTGNSGAGKECVMHATSTDRKSWTKVPEDTFYAPEGYSKDDFRDPEVFWSEEDGLWWMLVAARSDELGGVVARYTSDDLREWTFEGDLFAPREQYMLECPDLFRMGDTYYLTYSWDCMTYYAMAESPDGPFETPADNVFDGNDFVFYAAKTAEFEGERYLCGWHGRAGLTTDSGSYLWAGNVCNHQLVQHEDGTLGVCPPDAFEGYFTERMPFRAVCREGEATVAENSVALKAGKGSHSVADMGTRVPAMLLEADVTFADDGCVGFAFGGSEADETFTVLCLDARTDTLHYEGYEISDLERLEPQMFTAFDFEPGVTHHVRLVCENEIVVLYVDDMKALSSRITHSVDGAHIALFADGCDAEFKDITVRCPGA